MRHSMMAIGFRGLIGVMLLATAAVLAEAHQVKEAKCPMGRQYFLFTPDRIVPQQTYWLVVHVHCFGGSGSASDEVGQWADRGDCIAISPTFPSPEYTLLGADSGKQLAGCFKQLQEQYKLHSKLFIMGHSGGSQYAHRFMMKYPQLVVGCCATSGGSWSTGGEWGEINPAAATVPLAISCGLKDTEKMAAGAPWGRLDWARRFEALIKQNDFLYTARYWPNAGHGGDPAGNAKLAADAFSLGISGMLESERAVVETRIVRAAHALATGGQAAANVEIAQLRALVDARTANSVTSNLVAAGWHVSAESIAALLPTTRTYLDSRLAMLDTIASQVGSVPVARGHTGTSSATTGPKFSPPVIIGSGAVGGPRTVVTGGIGASLGWGSGQPSAGGRDGSALLRQAKPSDDPLYNSFKIADGVVVLTGASEQSADRGHHDVLVVRGTVVTSLKGSLKRGAVFHAAISTTAMPQTKLPATDFVLVTYRQARGTDEITAVTEATDARLRVAVAATGATPTTVKNLRAMHVSNKALAK